MTESQQLLAEYAASGSEAAFRELVERYINLVYSTALRLADGDSHLAEDVTQTVFTSLARKGPSLSSGVMLGGWLHQHTYHVVTRAMRSERRRQSREREAAEMNTLEDNSEANWRAIAPILDEAITRLPSADRTAILLRFFEQRDFRTVAAALGSNEDAARMRVNRALGKLQSLLKHRGITLSVTALGAVLTTQAISATPAALVLATTSAALAGAAAKGTALGFLKIIMTTKAKVLVGSLVVAGLATTVVIEHRAKERLQEQNEVLRQQVTQLDRGVFPRTTRRAAFTPRLPAPQMPAPNSTAPTTGEALAGTSLYALATNKTANLTMAKVEPYLAANGRNAASLLAAFRTTGDAALLQEAMQKYPNDPHVGFEAVLRKDISPVERRQWLDQFKQSAPDNALPNYLSAADHFKEGETDKAVQDIITASQKPGFEDYSLERIQDDDEVYRAAGHSVAEARILAASQLLLPQLVQMRDLGRSVVDLAKSYQQSGDEASREAALEIAANLGHRYARGGPGEPLISQLVGVHVERTALESMDPNSPWGNDGALVKDRIEQLVQQRAEVRELAKTADLYWDKMSEQDWISYHSRSAAFGEQSALRWIIGKYSDH